MREPTTCPQCGQAAQTSALNRVFLGGLPRSEEHIAYLEQWMIDHGFITGGATTFVGLLEQLGTQIYQMRAAINSWADEISTSEGVLFLPAEPHRSVIEEILRSAGVTHK